MELSLICFHRLNDSFSNATVDTFFAKSNQGVDSYRRTPTPTQFVKKGSFKFDLLATLEEIIKLFIVDMTVPDVSNPSGQPVRRSSYDAWDH